MFDDRTESFNIINTKLLLKTFSDQARLIPINSAIGTMLDLENSSTINLVAARRRRN